MNPLAVDYVHGKDEPGEGVGTITVEYQPDGYLAGLPEHPGW